MTNEELRQQMEAEGFRNLTRADGKTYAKKTLRRLRMEATVQRWQEKRLDNFFGVRALNPRGRLHRLAAGH